MRELDSLSKSLKGSDATLFRRELLVDSQLPQQMQKYMREIQQQVKKEQKTVMTLITILR